MTGRDDGGFSPHPGDPWHPGYPEGDVESDVADSEDSKPKKSKKPKQPKQAKQPKQSKRRGRRGAKAAADDEVAAAFDPNTSAFDESTTDTPESQFDDDPFDAVLQREGRTQRFKSDPDEVPAPAWTIDSEPDPDQRLPVEQPSWIGQSTGRPDTIEAVGFDEPVVDPASVTAPEAAPEEQSIEVSSEVVEAAAEAEAATAGADVADRPELSDVDVADLLEAPETEVVGEYGVAGPEAFDVLDTDDAATAERDDWDAFMTEAAVEASLDTVPEVPKKRRGRRGRKQHAPDVDHEGVVVVPAGTDPEAVQADDFAAVETPRKRRGRRGRKQERIDEVEEAVVAADSLDWSDEEPDYEYDRPKKRRFGRRKEIEVIDDGFVGAAFEPESTATDPEVPGEFPPVAGDFGRPAEPPAGADAFDEWMESAPADSGGFSKRRRRDVEDYGDEISADQFASDDGTPEDWPAYSAIDDEGAVGAEALTGEHPYEDPGAGDGFDSVAPEVNAAEQPAAGEVEFVDGEDDFESVVARALEALGAEGEDAGVESFGDMEVAEDVLDDQLSAGAIDQPDLFSSVESPQLDATAVPAQHAEVATSDAVPEGVDDDFDTSEPTEWVGDPGRVPAAWMSDIDEDEVVPPPTPETPDTEWPEDPQPGPWEGQAHWQAGDTEVFDIEEPAPPVPYVPDPAPPQEIVAIPEGYEPWQNAVDDAVAAAESGVDHPDDGTYEYEQPLLEQPAHRPDVLPAGFEPFPGGGAVDEFELSDGPETGPFATNPEGWVTDDIDPAAGQVEDAPYQSDEFDEQIYAGGGTMEHRDLAAAIALSGDEDTQWQALSAAMPGMETGVLGFDDVADLGTGGEYVAPIRSNFGLRVATGLALVGLLFGSLFIGAAAFAGFIGVMVLLGLVEFYGALRRCGYLPLSLFGLIGAGATLLAVWFHGPLAIPAGILITATVTFFFYAFSATRRDALSNAGLTVFGVSWIVGAVAFAIPIARAEDHIILIFAIVAVTAATDVGAYSFGRTWGKRPLAPVLSPNKTTEGLAGGVLMAFIVSGAIGFLEWGPFDLVSGLALGTVVVFAAPLGDLAESMIKRSLGIKDMGSILPGHGGILDRIDAFLFVIPAAWVLYKLIGFLG